MLVERRYKANQKDLKQWHISKPAEALCSNMWFSHCDLMFYDFAEQEVDLDCPVGG